MRPQRRSPVLWEAEARQEAWEPYGQREACPPEAAPARAGVAGRQDTFPGGNSSPPAVMAVPVIPPFSRFVEECNQQRAPVDFWVVVTLMSAVFLNMCKYKHMLPPLGQLGLLHTCLMYSLSIAILLWSRLHPASYAAWREPLAGTWRCMVMTGPMFTALARLIGTQVGQVAGHSGTAGDAAFLAGLVFVSHTPRLAILGLGLPLRAGGQLAVQLVSMMYAWRDSEATCAAVITAGAGLTATASPAGTTVDAGASASGAAATLVAGWFQRTSVLSMWLRPALPLPRQLTPLQQCRCLFGIFLALGLALPVLLQWAFESRSYCTFRRHFAGPRWRSRAEVGERAPLPWEDRTVCGFYRGLGALIAAMNLPTAVLLVGAGLGVVWELITRTV